MSPKAKARWKKAGKIALWTGVAAVGYELAIAGIFRRQRRRDVFNQALQAQHRTKKPLWVVGIPKQGLARVLGPDWDCADGCIAPENLVEQLQKFGNSSVVLFVGRGLEGAEDPGLVVREMQRVSGGDLFVAALEPYSLSAWMPWRKQRILTAPPKTTYVEYRALPWRPGPSQVARVAGLRRVV